MTSILSNKALDDLVRIGRRLRGDEARNIALIDVVMQAGGFEPSARPIVEREVLGADESDPVDFITPMPARFVVIPSDPERFPRRTHQIVDERWPSTNTNYTVAWVPNLTIANQLATILNGSIVS